MAPEPKHEPSTGAAGSSAAVERGAARAVASVRAGSTWEDVVEHLASDLAGSSGAELALVFVDTRFSAYYSDILARLQELLSPGTLAGCSGQAVIGPSFESEAAPAVAVLALHLPGASATPLALVPGVDPAEALENAGRAAAASWLVFADPFTVQVEPLVRELEARSPGAVILGGLASAYGGTRQTAVFLDGEVHDGGAVMIGLDAPLRLVPLVAQGAEPIGEPWTITDGEEHLIKTIGNRPALEVLTETLQGLDPDTRERAQRNLLVGIAMDEYRDSFGRGDYLIRNLVGADRDTGALAVNEIINVGRTIQFQFRDAAAADEDLRQRLVDTHERLEGEQMLGALLCTCNGRGTGLFGTPHHDAAALAEVFEGLPVAGLFCNGEIGPVGDRTYLHGFTASVGLLVLGSEGTPG